jgi:hypothetical protein
VRGASVPGKASHNGAVAKKIAIGWFPAGELEKALALWPALVAGWGVNGYAEYCRHIDHQLRALELDADTSVLLSPIEVKHFVKWCAKAALDSAAPESRSQYASEVATRGRARPWPPKPEKGCWCGRDESYELCCGRPD